MYVTTKTTQAALIVTYGIPDVMQRGRAVNSLLSTAKTSQQVAVFHELYKVPMGNREDMSVSDRERRLRLILEEFLELVEACGFELILDTARNLEHDCDVLSADDGPWSGKIGLAHRECSQQNHVEIMDALGDINYVIHGYAIELGYSLDDVTSEIHASNMTKLGVDGKPIVNGVTEGYKVSAVENDKTQPQYKPEVPIGKILKGPNYQKPRLAEVMGLRLPE